MPRGYRLYVAAALGLVVGAALIWALVADLSSVDQSYVHAATDASDHYRDDANRQIHERCLRPPGLHEPQCVEQIQDAARENQRREQDLAAQKMTAWWTKVMGVAALIGMTLSAIGVWLILATFRENKRAADAAHDANRPWLEVQAHVFKLWTGSNGASADVKCDLINRGNSPATDVALVVEMMAFTAGQLADAAPIVSRVRDKLSEIDKRRPHMGSVIFPTCVETDTISTVMTAEEVMAALEHPRGSVRFLIAVGTTYIFGERARHTVKCYDVFFSEKIDYTAPNLLHLVKLKPENVTDTFKGYAT